MTLFKFVEFFAGGGMARQGLGEGWKCLFANDICQKKSRAYVDNWGSGEMWTGDVAKVDARHLPNGVDLAWASFPSQDLSLAGRGKSFMGRGAGLSGERSGAFWPFYRLMAQLGHAGAGPRMLVLESVVSAITADAGQAFQAISHALAAADYRFGALILDAARWLPQSRQRLFFIAVRRDLDIACGTVQGAPLIQDAPPGWASSPALTQAVERLPREVADAWAWWAPEEPPCRTVTLSDVVEPDAPFAASGKTAALLRAMNPANKARVLRLQCARQRTVGTAYRRVRVEGGARVTRTEARFDGVAGSLQTPGGGSSRQFLIQVEGQSANRRLPPVPGTPLAPVLGQDVHSRLLTPRETARLMGLPDSYRLPESTTDALYLTGDGVPVPVVSYLAKSIIEPILHKNCS
jgi:DNA (cytosine-5)-methyltransferase 1